MVRRRSLVALSLLGAVSALAVTSPQARADEPTIAMVQINQQALFFTQMNEGAQKKADELEQTNTELEVTNRALVANEAEIASQNEELQSQAEPQRLEHEAPPFPDGEPARTRAPRKAS